MFSLLRTKHDNDRQGYMAPLCNALPNVCFLNG